MNHDDNMLLNTERICSVALLLCALFFTKLSWLYLSCELCCLCCYRNIAAVSAADVLVTIHGSGSNNVLFMREGSTLVEVRPYKFGTDASEWANFFIPEVTGMRFDCTEISHMQLMNPLKSGFHPQLGQGL